MGKPPMHAKHGARCLACRPRDPVLWGFKRPNTVTSVVRMTVGRANAEGKALSEQLL